MPSNYAIRLFSLLATKLAGDPPGGTSPGRPARGDPPGGTRPGRPARGDPPGETRPGRLCVMGWEYLSHSVTVFIFV